MSPKKDDSPRSRSSNKKTGPKNKDLALELLTEANSDSKKDFRRPPSSKSSNKIIVGERLTTFGSPDQLNTKDKMNLEVRKRSHSDRKQVNQKDLLDLNSP